MPVEMTAITTPFMLNVTVSCYLVRAGDGFILIDTDAPPSATDRIRRWARGFHPGRPS
jgi:glyoxylase-like metal-dependent hydrolase (beta-lactamase superfamily II)